MMRTLAATLPIGEDPREFMTPIRSLIYACCSREEGQTRGAA
jgi:hypothetical protein